MPLASRYFAAYADRQRWIELTAPAGDLPRERAIVRGFVVPPGATAAHVKRAAGELLRWLGRGLLLGPLLALVRFGLEAPLRDWLTVGYVCLVVAFFAVLNVYIVVAVVGWRASTRGKLAVHPPVALSLPRHARGALEVPAADAIPPEPGTRIRAQGRVVELSPRRSKPGPVMRDVWLEDGPGRVTEVVAFAVCADDRMPVILSFDSAPTLVAASREQPLGEVLAAMGPEARRTYDRAPLVADDRQPASTLELCEGDEVAVAGVVTAVLADAARFELDGVELCLPRPGGHSPGSPYREHTRQLAVLVTSIADEPVMLHRLTD